jgi:hypothetical protein
MRVGSANLNSAISGVSARQRPGWLRTRRVDDETNAPEPQPGIQGESGIGCLKGERTLAKLAQQFNVHANQITQWTAQLLGGAAGIFGSEAKAGDLSPENSSGIG